MNKEKIESIVHWLAIVVIIGLLGYMTIRNYTPLNDPGEYDFCVEWEGDYTRENLIWKAYNYKDQEINFDWYMTGDLLVRHNNSNPEEVFGEHFCIRKVKSVPISTMAIKRAEEAVSLE